MFMQFARTKEFEYLKANIYMKNVHVKDDNQEKSKLAIENYRKFRKNKNIKA